MLETRRLKSIKKGIRKIEHSSKNESQSHCKQKPPLEESFGQYRLIAKRNLTELFFATTYSNLNVFVYPRSLYVTKVNN